MELSSFPMACFLLLLALHTAPISCSNPTDTEILKDWIQAGLDTVWDTIDNHSTSTPEDGLLFGVNATVCDVLEYRSFLQYLTTEVQPENLNSSTLLFVTDLHLPTSCYYEKSVVNDSQYNDTSGSQNWTEVDCNCLSSIFQHCLSAKLLPELRSNVNPRPAPHYNETIIIGPKRYNYIRSEWLMQLLSDRLPESSVQQLLAYLTECDISDPQNITCLDE